MVKLEAGMRVRFQSQDENLPPFYATVRDVNRETRVVEFCEQLPDYIVAGDWISVENEPATGR